jgi:hypothetical protein
MGSRGHPNLKRKRTRKEPTTTEGDDHADDLMKSENRTNQLLATKPAAAEEAQPAGAGKTTKEKRKRVVMERLPEKFIHIMIVRPHCVYEISDERLAQRSEEFRASYAETKAKSEKMQADQQALIDQYLIHGYAESIREVTDDEDDGDE